MTPEPLVRAQTATQVVRAGGLADTCRFFSIRADEEALVVGLGMQRAGSRSRPMDDSAWTKVLAAPDPGLEELDGHFVVLRWSDHRWQAWTDRLGVRTLYLAPWRDGILYSTRLDWLCRCTHRHALDLDAFGGHWLTFNQLTTDALVQDVERLGPNAHAHWDADAGLRRTETPWTPPFSDGDDGSSFEAALSAFVHPALPADARL
ncbi:MAG: hypothetical protein GVY18_12130, partial [Bacteroidetes bacterium]|nr:hypothetical protein [Bacteroidota bacterium]